MKKWLFVALAAAVLLTAAPLALAGSGGAAQGHHKFQLVGRIVSADPAAQTVNILVKAGTRTVRDYKRTDVELVLSVPATARLRVVTEDGCGPATFDQLWPGAKVKAGGTIGLDEAGAAVFTATRVKARLQGVTPPALPEPAPEDPPTPLPDV